MSKYYRQQIKKWLAGAKTQSTYASRRRRLKIVSILAGLAIIFVFLGVLGVFGVVAYYSKDLPSPDRLSTRQVPQSTKIFTRDGVLLYEVFGDERRTLVTLADLPEFLKQATIAVEDADFYSHRGFDLEGMLRAIWVIVRGEGLQGGSTITQQVVKNTLLSPERTWTRKIKEFILAIQLERQYTKDQILQMYFNEVPYGGQAWGVGAAAEMYFGKHVRDLTLAESTMIAGLPQAPSIYSPCGAYPENTQARQAVVLNLMVKNGFIAEEQVEQTLQEELNVICQGYSAGDIKAPHFVMYVKSLLTEMFGEKLVEQGGLRVMTTLDWKAQQIAEEEVKKQLENLAAKNANASNAGAVVVNPQNGHIHAMVGSADYFDSEHDGNVNVILAERQPGSSIKPLTYLTAFKLGYTPATFISDIRTCFPGGAGQPDYCPVNWDDKFWGPMTVRTALANSRNIPAVKMLQVVGVQNMIDLSHQLGITTLNETDRYGLSLTLGGGEVRPIDMAQVFAVFANSGIKNELTPIQRVEDSTGKVLHEFKSASRKVIEPEYVYPLNHILADGSVRRATFGNSLEIGRTLAVKTGTTNDNRDAWTIGYTPQLVNVVWVGNFNNDPMNGIFGSTGATPIMKGIMERLLEGEAEQKWEVPNKIVNMSVDKISGLIPQENRGFDQVNEVFVKGTQPREIDDFHVTVEVCQDDQNKIATEWHQDRDLVVEKTFIYLKELSGDWQRYTDEWMLAKRDEGYGQPPTEKCQIKLDGEVVKGPIIEFVAPLENAVIEKTLVSVSAKVYSQERITAVEFYWDDFLIQTLSSSPYETQFDLTEIEAEEREPGLHTIKIVALDANGDENEVAQEINLIQSTRTID